MIKHSRQMGSRAISKLWFLSQAKHLFWLFLCIAPDNMEWYNANSVETDGSPAEYTDAL